MSGRNNCREINVDRNILQAGEIKRIGMGVVAVVAHQGAAPALLMVKLALRKAIVDQQQGATTQAMRPFRRPSARCQANLAFKTRW